MWIARNKEGLLRAFFKKPIRFENVWNSVEWYDVNSRTSVEKNVITLDDSLFPKLTWEDEPLEVELTAMSQFERFIDDVIHMYISSREDDRFSCDAERIRYIQDTMCGKNR